MTEKEKPHSNVLQIKQPPFALRTSSSAIIPLISKVRHGLFVCFSLSLGLNGIKVIVKSLGSGFHLPVPGLPRYDLVSNRTSTPKRLSLDTSYFKVVTMLLFLYIYVNCSVLVDFICKSQSNEASVSFLITVIVYNKEIPFIISRGDFQ